MYKAINHRLILNTPRFAVFHDRVYDRGKKNRKDYYYLVKPNAVVILASKPDAILFLRVRRYLTRAIRYELPGGRVEKGESAIETAKRELEEETGLTSKKWNRIGSTYSLPSITTEKVDIFSAAISAKQTATLSVNARDEGIVDCKFLGFDRVWSIVSRNQVATPIDGFGVLLFLGGHFSGASHHFCLTNSKQD
jgi:8-oxo-dGTP pyrophosphatase MutT (NUDIX family)